MIDFRFCTLLFNKLVDSVADMGMGKVEGGMEKKERNERKRQLHPLVLRIFVVPIRCLGLLVTGRTKVALLLSRQLCSSLFEKCTMSNTVTQTSTETA